jgi:neutral ceramidase
VSGDFPAMARQYLQENVLGADCPVVWHTGPSGNQSPRHVARSNTFAEAERLGHLLGRSIAGALATIEYRSDLRLICRQTLVDLPVRRFPPVAEAERQLAEAGERLQSLRRARAPRGEIRTAECDWFGAEETLALARAAADGRLERTAADVLPAEVQWIEVGPWSFAGWPGEAYVEFGLAVKARHRHCRVICLANGELQGYLVTDEAVRHRHYEAMNALLASPESGQRLVEATLRLAEGRGWADQESAHRSP